MLLTAGGQLFGVPITTIREVVPAVSATPLPGAAAYVRGLINLRGQVITVIELAALQGLAYQGSRSDESIVLVEAGERLVGLVVSGAVKIAHDHVAENGFEDEPYLSRNAGIMGREEDGESQAVYTMLDLEDLLTPLFS